MISPDDHWKQPVASATTVKRCGSHADHAKDLNPVWLGSSALSSPEKDMHCYFFCQSIANVRLIGWAISLVGGLERSEKVKILEL